MAWVACYPDAQYGTALYEREVQRVNDCHTCLSLALLNRNMEKIFLFKKMVTTVILHFLLAFEVWHLVAILCKDLVC